MTMNTRREIEEKRTHGARQVDIEEERERENCVHTAVVCVHICVCRNCVRASGATVRPVIGTPSRVDDIQLICGHY